MEPTPVTDQAWQISTIGVKIDTITEIFSRDLPPEYPVHFYSVQASHSGDLLHPVRENLRDIAECLALGQLDLEFDQTGDVFHPFQVVAEQPAPREDEDSDVILLSDDDYYPDLDVCSFPESFDPGLSTLGLAPAGALPRRVKQEPEGEDADTSRDQSREDLADPKSADKPEKKKKKRTRLPREKSLTHDMRGNPMSVPVSLHSV